MCLEEEGIKEKDVKLITDQNIKLKELAEILKSQRVGLDSESNNVFHMYEDQNPVLLQVAMQEKIYIFDINSLKDN